MIIVINLRRFLNQQDNRKVKKADFLHLLEYLKTYLKEKSQQIIRWKMSDNFLNDSDKKIIIEFIGNTSLPSAYMSAYNLNDKISLVWIYNDMDHPQVIKRMKLVGRILENRVENQIKLNYNYSSLIESLLNATIYTDILSYYVAILGGINPTPVDIIKVLKSEL